jgi:dienelactone hydrolase
MKRINFKQVIVVPLIALVVAASAFVFWARDVSQPTQAALTALESDDQVVIKEEAGLLTFAPINAQPSTGFIFYPGGRVDYRAYAPILRQIAAQGYFVVVKPMPLNLAFFNINAADQVIAQYPDIQYWAVGGHSLGGVAAASYAAKHPAISGIVFWASYPADASLKDKNVKVLSIYGSNDGLSIVDKIDESRALLPVDGMFVEILGGNHGQFGSYGPQAGDNAANISPEGQWAQTADATSIFLASLSR